MKIKEFDSQERARQKAESRQADENDIAEGKADRDDVQKRNAFIPGDIARRAKIIDWGYKS